jgi:hypothetical protein
LELITARKFVQASTKTVLIINKQPILDESGELHKIGVEANERFVWFASQHDVESIEVRSKQEAVHTLETFA